MSDVLNDEQAQRVGKALAQLADASDGRVFAVIIPRRWPVEDAKRLVRVVNFILEGDGTRLFGFECCAEALRANAEAWKE
jgi:hypothetical protein